MSANYQTREWLRLANEPLVEPEPSPKTFRVNLDGGSYVEVELSRIQELEQFDTAELALLLAIRIKREHAPLYLVGLFNKAFIQAQKWH